MDINELNKLIGEKIFKEQKIDKDKLQATLTPYSESGNKEFADFMRLAVHVNDNIILVHQWRAKDFPDLELAIEQIFNCLKEWGIKKISTVDKILKPTYCKECGNILDCLFLGGSFKLLEAENEESKHKAISEKESKEFETIKLIEFETPSDSGAILGWAVNFIYSPNNYQAGGIELDVFAPWMPIEGTTILIPISQWPRWVKKIHEAYKKWQKMNKGKKNSNGIKE